MVLNIRPRYIFGHFFPKLPFFLTNVLAHLIFFSIYIFFFLTNICYIAVSRPTSSPSNLSPCLSPISPSLSNLSLSQSSSSSSKVHHHRSFSDGPALQGLVVSAVKSEQPRPPASSAASDPSPSGAESFLTVHRLLHSLVSQPHLSLCLWIEFDSQGRSTLHCGHCKTRPRP